VVERGKHVGLGKDMSYKERSSSLRSATFSAKSGETGGEDLRRLRKTCTRRPWLSSRIRWRWTPSGLATQAEARWDQYWDAEDKCGRGEREMDDETDGRAS
jgi:hypothetical protein